MNSKYKISINDLEKSGSIAKFERDGFTREQISKQMYKQTDGMTTQQRNELVSKFYERNPK